MGAARRRGRRPVLDGAAAPGRAGSAGGGGTGAAADHAHLLPEPIRQFTRRSSYDPGTGRLVEVGAGHSGSHPHLAHEFVSAVVQGRRAAVDVATAARWTLPGICAHASALAEGRTTAIPVVGEG